MRNEKGFTLIELVMVIVLLGILAAVAIPRFADLSTQAKISSVNGMYGGVQGAAAMVYAQSLIEGEAGSAAAAVTIEGQVVNTVFGYPANADIDNAMSAFDGFTFVLGPPSLFNNNSDTTPADCRVEYTQPAAVNTRPTIARVITCL